MEGCDYENEHENDLLVHVFVRRRMSRYGMNSPRALIGSFAVWHSRA